MTIPSLEKVQMNQQKDSIIDKVLAERERETLELLKGAFDFGKRELKLVSVIKTNKYLSFILKFWILNKKQVNRKFIADLKEIDKNTSEAIARKPVETDNSGFLSNLFNRNR